MDDLISKRKVFVGGLAAKTTGDSLKAHFEQFGEVQDSVIMTDRNTGRSRCFGFVIMQRAEDVDRILEQPQTIDQKKVDCKRAVPRDTNQNTVAEFRTKRVFVGGLSPEVTNEVFREYFSLFGEVEDSIVILDKETGRPRGFGFITFYSEDSTERVLENYDRNMINGKWVECKKATPKQTQYAYSYPYMAYPNPAVNLYQYSFGLNPNLQEFWPGEFYQNK